MRTSRTKAAAVARSQVGAMQAAVIATARAMSANGLSPGRSGNVSCRWQEGMLITPSGMSYDELTPGDIVYVDEAGDTQAGGRKPSSEWRFHLAAYAARPDRHAVVHAHSLHCVALACAGKSIPAFHYMVAVAGGDDIPVVPYETFGTPELARNVARGLAARDACLMANHGQIAIGETLGKALELATEVETLAAQYIMAKTIGTPVLLSKKEMAEVLERFKSYGQNAQELPTKAPRRKS